MSALDAVATLAAWSATSEDDRGRALDELATSLGPDWARGRVAVGRCRLGELRHARHGAFVVVPGGWLRMGLSSDDLFAAAAARDDASPGMPFGPMPFGARPTRWVRMRPYLLAVAGVPPADGDAGTDGGAASLAYRDAVDGVADGSGPSAQELVDAYDGRGPRGPEPAMRRVTPATVADVVPPGFRLPSEAELEWALREGGTTRWIGVAGDVVVTPANRRDVLLGDLDNGFGLVGLRDLQNLCADGAASYDAASPTDQDARATDRGERIARWAHTYWQDDDAELTGVLAGSRAAPDEYGESIARLACDLPGARAPEGDPPAALAEHDATLDGLRRGGRAHADALTALGYLAQGPGADVADTAQAAIAALATASVDARVDLLIWLADVQVGGHREATVAPPERARREALRPDRAAVRAAVAAASDVIAGFLDDPEARVRSTAALALTFTVDASASARAALAARLEREPEVGVQAAIVLALARLGADVRAPSDAPLVRAAITVGTAFDGAPDVPALLTAMRVPPSGLLAFNFGDLGAVAVGILRKLDAGAQREAAPALAAWAAERGHPQLVQVAFEMAFGTRPPRPTPRLPAELDATQREVMTALCMIDGGLRWSAYGLPRGASARRRFLGLDPGGPLDALVAEGEREVPLWYAVAIAGQDGPAAVARHLGDASPGLRLAAWLERDQFSIDRAFEPWDIDELMNAAAADPGAATHVDGVRARWHGDYDAELVEAIARTGGADPELLARLGDRELGRAAVFLDAFPPEAVEARVLDAIRPHLERALASDGWSIGLDQWLGGLAPVLEAVPSARVARQVLLLGWASGQPAKVREAVATAAGHHAAIGAVLAEYDALPEHGSWPRAREAMASYAA